MNKSQQAYERDKVMYALVGECCPTVATQFDTIDGYRKEYEEYKESLDEINCLIMHFKDIGNFDEVAYLRRLLMRTKMQIREMKANMIEVTNKQWEEAYS